ncbi:MAG: hypothetical protein GC164_14505 [Phycisphaera sp.]|nr:hypothetical protein [Phycisphaera sp.]
MTVLCLFTVGWSARAYADDEVSQENALRLYNMHWRSIAAYFVEHDGAYTCFPNYKRGTLNSSGQTQDEYKKSDTYVHTYPDANGKDQSVTLTKPQEEIDAATRALPSFNPGDYGYLQSAKVAKVLDDQTMILKDIKLIDASKAYKDYEDDMDLVRLQAHTGRETVRRSRHDSRYRADEVPPIAETRYANKEAVEWRFEQRLKLIKAQRKADETVIEVHGFSTKGLREGQNWPTATTGIQIAIVEGNGKVNDSALAVPGSTVGRGVTEEQFKAILADHKLDPISFGRLLYEIKRRDSAGWEPLALAALNG